MVNLFNGFDFGDKKIRYGNLLSVTYSRSGDMNGNVDSISLDTKKLLITTKYAVMHSDPLEVKEYSVTDKEVYKLSSMVDKKKLLELSKLPMGDLFAYDAPTTTLSFTYDNSDIGGSSYDNYSINYYMEFSSSDRKKLKEFTDYLFSLVSEERLKRSYKE